MDRPQPSPWMGPDMPTVSVIIPCYSHGRYLPDALDSVLAQTYTDWEASLSTTARRTIRPQSQRRTRSATRESSTCTRLMPVSAARNRASELAQGDYIAFLDADDLYLPNALADHVAFLHANRRYSVSYSDGFPQRRRGSRALSAVRNTKRYTRQHPRTSLCFRLTP